MSGIEVRVYKHRTSNIEHRISGGPFDVFERDENLVRVDAGGDAPEPVQTDVRAPASRSLEDLTFAELKTLAEESGIKGRSKAALIAGLRAQNKD